MSGTSIRITVIIPSLRGQAEELIASLANQSCPPDEVLLVKGIRPNGRARNLGVRDSQGEILVFIDDDARPGNPLLLENLVNPLLQNVKVGVTGTARVLPPGASWFQRRLAVEIPRMVNPVPTEPLETAPPLNGYGHSLITTTCCAIRRETLEATGGFREDLPSGVDTEFFFRVRRLGYRFLMVPGTYVEHPPPATLMELLRKFHWYGLGYAKEAQIRAEQKLGPKLTSSWRRIAFLLAASLWLFPNIFILYSFSYPHLELGFRPFKALSTYAVAWGYVHGWGTPGWAVAE